MKEFKYTITDPLGIHARPAGLLAKTAKSFGDTVVTVTKDGSTVCTGPPPMARWPSCSP